MVDETAPPSPPNEPEPTRRSLPVRLLRGLGVFGLVVTSLGLATQTPAGRGLIGKGVELLGGQLLAPGWRFTRAELRWRWDGIVAIDDFALVAPDGHPVLGVRHLALDVDMEALLRGTVRVEPTRIDGVRAHLTTARDGTLDLAEAFGPPSDEPTQASGPFEGLPITIDVRDLRVRDVSVRLDQFVPECQDHVTVNAVMAWDECIPAATSVRTTPLWLDAVGLTLDRLYMPAHETVADVRGLELSGILREPVFETLALSSDLRWMGDEVAVRGLHARVGISDVHLQGAVDALSEGGVVDARLDVSALDLELIEGLTGAPLAGVYAGALELSGPLDAFGISGTLAGTCGTEGALSLRPGSALCLPMGDGANHAACRGEHHEPTPEGEAPDLAWFADIDAYSFAVEDLVPIVGGPLVVNGHVSARGAGVSWPKGMVIQDIVVDDAHDVDIWGIPFREISARGAIEDGVLTIQEGHVVAVAGEADVTATLDFESGELDGRIDGRIDAEMLRDLEVEDVGGRGWFTARVTGDIYGEEVPIDVQGRAHMAPASYGDDIRIETLDADVTVAVRDGITDVWVDAHGANGWAYGATLAEVSVPDLHVRVADDIVVTGEAQTPRVDYGDTAYADAVRAPFSYVAPEEGEAVTEVDVVMRDHGLLGLMGNNGHANLVLIGDSLDARVDLRWDDDPFIVAPSVHMNLETMRVRVPSIIFAPTSRQRWRLTEPLDLRITEGGVADARVALTSPLGSIDLDGTLGTVGPLDATLQVDAFDLDAVAELFPELVGAVDGVIDLSLRADGDASNPSLSLTVDAEDVFYPDTVRWLDVSGGADVADGVMRLDLSAGVVDEPLLTLRGTVPVDLDLSAPTLGKDGSADVALTVLPGTYERFSRLVPELEVPEGRLSAQAVASGNLLDPTLDIRGVTTVRAPGWVEPARVEFVIDRTDRTLTTSVDAYRGLSRLALLDGTADTRLGELMDAVIEGRPLPEKTSDLVAMVVDDLDMSLHDIDMPIDDLEDLAGFVSDLTGRVTGSARVTGSPTRPDAEIDLAMAGSVLGRDVEGVVLLEPADEGDGYDGLLRLGGSDDPWLRVDGRVPMDIDFDQSIEAWGVGDLALTATGSGVPMWVAGAFLPGLRDTAGTLQLGGTVGGPWRAPEPDLVVSARGLEAGYRPLGLALKSGDLSARVETLRAATDTKPLRWSVVLDELTARTAPLSPSLASLTQAGPSSIVADGSVVLDGLTVDRVKGVIDLRNAWLSATDGERLQVGGQLDVTGSWPGLIVEGSVAVTQGDFFANLSDLLADRSSKLDPRITVHRGAGPQINTTSPPEDSVLDDMRIAIDVDLGRNTNARLLVPVLEDLGAVGASVTRADIQARMGGELDVVIDHGDIFIGGEIDLLEGRVSILRSKFELSNDSQIVFLGRDYANPRLDVRGTMSVTGGDVNLELAGTADAPKLRLSSDDFGSDAELFTILLTGQAPEELSSQEGTAALEAVSDLFVQSVLGGVDLGSVSVGGDGRVMVSIPLARTVHVSTEFDPTPALNENRYTVEAEWSITPGLVLDAAYGDRRIWGDIFYEIRFDDVRRKANAAKESKRDGPTVVTPEVGLGAPEPDDAPPPETAEDDAARAEDDPDDSADDPDDSADDPGDSEDPPDDQAEPPAP